MIKIDRAIDDAEKVLETNIARSILDLEIHKNMKIKDLRIYYGKDFTDKDRQGLVQDTIRKLEWERMLLEELRERKPEIIKKYTYDKIKKGNFRGIDK
jgi:hypothetical protein